LKFTFKVLREFVSRINRDEFDEPDAHVSSWEIVVKQSGSPKAEPEVLDAIMDDFTRPTNGETTFMPPTLEGLWLSYLDRQLDLPLLRKRIEKGETFGEGILFNPPKWNFRIRPTPPSQEECTAVVHLALKAVILPVRDFVFCKNGDFWEIVYEDKPFPMVKHETGLDYISHLLGHAGARFETPHQLEDAVKGVVIPPDNVCSGMGKEALLEVGLSIEGRSSSGTIDPKAVGEYKKKAKELEGEIKKARENNDPAQVDLLMKDLAFIAKELKAGKASSGKTVGSPQEEKARKKISEAINKAIKNIEKQDKSVATGLGQHLSLSLTPITWPYFYRPDREINWITK